MERKEERGRAKDRDTKRGNRERKVTDLGVEKREKEREEIGGRAKYRERKVTDLERPGEKKREKREGAGQRIGKRWGRTK